MPLSPAQKTTLRLDIIAKQAIGQPLFGVTDEQPIANYYNATTSTVVERTSLSRHEVLTATSPEATTFTWTAGAYITRSQGERDAFREIFNSTGSVNPSMASIKAAFADIFSGAGGATNRTHITAMSKRVCSRLEALFAVGAGTLASPSTLFFEGTVTPQNIADVVNGV